MSLICKASVVPSFSNAWLVNVRMRQDCVLNYKTRARAYVRPRARRGAGHFMHDARARPHALT